MGNDKKYKKQDEEVKKLLLKGVDGDKRAVKKAYEMLVLLREAEPNNALYQAYYGSCMALLARDAVKTLDKADKAQEALDSLDRAVALDPNDTQIRLLRGTVCLRLPENYFHCSKTAIEDFTFVLERYKEDKDAFSKSQAAEIVRNLSTAYQNAGKPTEAQAALQLLPQLNPKKK